MRDIICNEMKDIYERCQGEEEIRESLRLERATEEECERRDVDARSIIRGERLSSCLRGKRAEACAAKVLAAVFSRNEYYYNGINKS